MDNQRRKNKGVVPMISLLLYDAILFTVIVIMLCEDVKDAPYGSVVEKYVRSLEKFINENPDNWLWSHRRWKHSRTESVKVESA